MLVVGGNEVVISAGETVTPVSIDIKPGEVPNSINLNSKGVIPVAIISTTAFDATTVDPTTVTLADAQVRVRGKGIPLASTEDVNADGLLDLVVHVETTALQLTESTTLAQLRGETFDGTAISGSDMIRVVAALNVAGSRSDPISLGDSLTTETLRWGIDQSITHWADNGVESSRLQDLTEVDLRISDFSGSLLGLASLDVVWLDRDAGGYGWSVNHRSAGVNLVSALTHEFGPILGLHHDHHDDVWPRL